ncbi:hypothetical protein, partial [Acinetobacter baumannii]|uniref:hypothetical protein n=1 Tax=Acinetobacter baumannii TaxID=470 RepID=UPI001C0A0763
VSAGLVPAFEPPARDGVDPGDWEKKEASARNAWELRAEQPVKEAFRQITLWKVWGLTAEMVDKPGRPARPDPVQ